MTTYQTDGRVVGGQVSPNFGAQNGQIGAGGGVIALPANMSMLEAMSRGILPRNALVNTINGVSCGMGISGPTPVADLCSNGAGQQVNLGVAVAGVAGNPVTNGANDTQQFVDGTGVVAQSANGPTPTSVEALTGAPVSVNTNGSAVGLTAGGFQG